MTDFIVRAPDDGFSNESSIRLYPEQLMHSDSFYQWRGFREEKRKLWEKVWKLWEKERRKAKNAKRLLKKIHGLKELIEDLGPTREIEPEIVSWFSKDYYFINGSWVSKMEWDLTIILDWMESKDLKNTMPDRYEAIKRSKTFGTQKKNETKMLAQTCEFLKKYALSNYMKELLAENAEAEIAEALSRENILMIFLTVILFISNFLSMFISSRCKKRYILLWTDTAVLLVLWTCGDVEQNPGPNKTTPGKRRSKILREFRRSVQTILLELIYKAYGEEMPSKPYSKSPPGWDDYKPEMKFDNISNPKYKDSREDKILNKMICILKNQKLVPLSSEWEILLSHYTNLDEKLEVEDSRKALARWMLEKKLAPLLKNYSEEVDVPSGDILSICECILKKVQVDVLETMETDGKDRKTKERETNGPEQFIAEARREYCSSKLFKVQTDVLETKEDDGKDWKTHESESNGSGLLIAEARGEKLSWKLLRSKEGCKSDFEESAGSSGSIDHYTEIKSVEVPDHSQRKRKRMETINTKTQETSKENNPLFSYNYGVDTLKTTGEQNLRMNEENVDLNMARSNSAINESNRDQISLTGDKFGERQETFPSTPSSAEERHDKRTCQESIPDLDMGQNEGASQDVIPDLDMIQYSEILNTICDDIEYNLTDEEILRMSLKRYLKELGNNKPSSIMIELCKDILNK